MLALAGSLAFVATQCAAMLRGRIAILGGAASRSYACLAFILILQQRIAFLSIGAICYCAPGRGDAERSECSP